MCVCKFFFYLHRLHYRKLFICEKALFQRIHVWMSSKEWWRWCIFNLFVDSVFLYVIDLQRISLQRSFMSYKISSVTFLFTIWKGYTTYIYILLNEKEKRKKSKSLAFRLFIFRSFLSKQKWCMVCMCVCMFDILIFTIIVTRISIFSRRKKQNKFLVFFFALPRKFSIFCSYFVFLTSMFNVHISYFFHSCSSISPIHSVSNTFTNKFILRHWQQI